MLGRGKVRENYAVGEDKILIVTSDRLSAFDVIMNQPIPGKGKVLNRMSDFWFDKLAAIVPNHLTGIAPESVVTADEVEQVRGRAVVAKRLQPIMVEAVVRGLYHRLRLEGLPGYRRHLRHQPAGGFAAGCQAGRSSPCGQGRNGRA